MRRRATSRSFTRVRRRSPESVRRFNRREYYYQVPEHDASALTHEFIGEFANAICSQKAELFAIRAQTFILRHLRKYATILGYRQLEAGTLWELVRTLFPDDEYRSLRSDIRILADFRNNIAHGL